MTCLVVNRTEEIPTLVDLTCRQERWTVNMSANKYVRYFPMRRAMTETKQGGDMVTGRGHFRKGGQE